MTSSRTPRIAFIGGGMMAEAILRGLLDKQIAPPDEIMVSEPVAERRAQLESLGVRTTAANLEAVRTKDLLVLVLAVKPQVLPRVLEELAGHVAPEVLVFSIIAGAPIATLRQALGTPAVVRVMPNTPAQVGEGMSVWTATPETTADQRERAAAMVRALGVEIYVESESHLDMATAISGSGPAYVFLFMEALTDAAVQLGLQRPVAEKLVLQTVRGSAIYAQQTGEHPAVLRNRVTSPGGTTADALFELEAGGLRATVARAVRACYDKARYLGGLQKA
ncbi:MAG: pyrroline-5-carboxylate reductase [Anaerolineae bacterium]